MLGFNINGDKDTAELLGEIFSAKRRKQGEIKRNLEIAQKQSEIQHINAQTRSDVAKTRRDIAAIDLDNANAELIRAQAMKTREEALKLRLENIEFFFELAKRENIVFSPNLKLEMIVNVLLEKE
ncbi:MAG TPA: hypothetical protein DCX54_01860 [Flavobacteriales bacterium]|nr:hypothetical protein [Flavobacteriales bacterium]